MDFVYLWHREEVTSIIQHAESLCDRVAWLFGADLAHIIAFFDTVPEVRGSWASEIEHVKAM